MKLRRKKVDFLGILGATVLGNVFTGKGVVSAGKGVVSAERGYNMNHMDRKFQFCNFEITKYFSCKPKFNCVYSSDIIYLE